MTTYLISTIINNVMYNKWDVNYTHTQILELKCTTEM